MRLYAISDLHLDYPENRRALVELPRHADDWLIVAGDIADKFNDIAQGLDLLTERFARVIWTPGNHDLWTLPDDPHNARGAARYESLVKLCRERGVLTPEDPFAIWPGEGPRCVIAPLFVLYDYSFRPDTVPEGNEIAWAMESDIYATDERYLHVDPFADKRQWCQQRCALTERRLDEIDAALPTVLVNHFPLRRDHARLPAIPRFSIWCGTRHTEAWHTRYRAQSVVYGHLHIRASTHLDGVRFDEVSLGYPRHWRPERGLQAYLREILPGNSQAPR